MRIWTIVDQENNLLGCGRTIREAAECGVVAKNCDIDFIIAVLLDKCVSQNYRVHRVEITEDQYISYAR